MHSGLIFELRGRILGIKEDVEVEIGTDIARDSVRVASVLRQGALSLLLTGRACEKHRVRHTASDSKPHAPEGTLLFPSHMGKQEGTSKPISRLKP